MIPSREFAVVTDYLKRGSGKSSGMNIIIHAVLLSNDYNASNIMMCAYEQNQSDIPKKIKTLLKKHIPENYEIYPCDGYYEKYSKILEELEPKFIFKKIDDAPNDIQGEILKNFQKVNTIKGVNMQKCIDALVEKESHKK